MLRFSLPAVVLLLPGIAAAQTAPGIYIGGEAGAGFAEPMLSSGGTTNISTNPGPVTLGSIGWGFGNGLRAEVEGSYRSNGIGGTSTLRANGSLVPLTNTHGNVATDAVMANIGYDIPFHGFAVAVQPYVGVGVGYSWLHVDGGGDGLAVFHLPGNNTFGPAPSTVGFGSAGAMAYQAIAGLSVPLGVPGLAATLEYRFFGTARADIPVSRVADTTDTVNGATPSSATHNGFELYDNAVLIGVRYRFGAP